MNTALEQQVDSYIREQMDRKHIPGLSLAVIQDGATILEKSYGFANLELGVPTTSDTVYEIFSMTKGFVAAAIMMLVEAGQLSLDESLDRFRPGLPDAWNEVTVRRLITHTSGLSQWKLQWIREDLTIAEIDELAFGQPPQIEPGTQFEYINLNYNLLGMIIHQLTGQPYDEFLTEYIFERLGMHATRHNDVRAIVPNRATGYAWANDRLSKPFPIRWNAIKRVPAVPANGASGSLLSSLSDLIKWDRALTNGQILSQASQDELWSPLILKNGRSVPWLVQEFHGHRLIEFGGGYPGFTTCMTRFVDDGLTVIILTNQDSQPCELCKEVAGLVAPAFG